MFDRFSAASEGRLAKIRAHVVSRQSCAAVAKELGLGEQLLDYAGSVPKDELQRISRSRNVLAAVLEAAIAAVYLVDNCALRSGLSSKKVSGADTRVAEALGMSASPSKRT